MLTKNTQSSIASTEPSAVARGHGIVVQPKMSISIAEAIQEAAQILRKAACLKRVAKQARCAAFVLRRDRTFLISHAEHQLSNDSLDEFRTGVERRASGEPLQYITGVQDFSDATVRVTLMY